MLFFDNKRNIDTKVYGLTFYIIFNNIHNIFKAIKNRTRMFLTNVNFKSIIT